MESGTDEMTRIEAMRGVLEPLWAIEPPGPDNLYQNPAFLAVKGHCEANYASAAPGLGSTFALADALRALGLPCTVKSSKVGRPGEIEVAAERLVKALEATMICRRYLCPLNWADTLPELTFGQATVRSPSSGELAVLSDAPRL